MRRCLTWIGRLVFFGVTVSLFAQEAVRFEYDSGEQRWSLDNGVVRLRPE